jgi:hypothetical protein
VTFADCVQAALPGTGRQAPPAPRGDGPLARHLAAVDPTDREAALLAAAALTAGHERAGRLAARDPGPAPEPCPEESRPRAGEAAGALLRRVLGGEHPELLPEWLALAAAAGRLAPAELLPALLDASAADAGRQAALLPVLGGRGRWLAAQQPAWAWVLGAAAPDEAAWHAGTPEVRRAFLARLRAENPARAVELLRDTWPQEAADDRAWMVAALETGLGPADEAFLEAALDDRRKEVRRVAAGLLARLPGSALGRRMAERTRPLLRLVPGTAGSLLKLRAARPAVVEATLPEACDRALQRDGVEPKPPAGFGEKAWWLVQMLEATPLGVWGEAWSLTPSAALAAAAAGEWAKDLLEGWARAAVRQRDAAWAAELFPAALAANRADLLEPLLAVLPAAEREARLAPLLAADAGDAGRLLAGAGPWSAAFSRAVLDWLRRQAARGQEDWDLRARLAGLAPLLHPDTLAGAASGWPVDAAGWDFWSRAVDAFLAAVQFRADLHAAFR